MNNQLFYTGLGIFSSQVIVLLLIYMGKINAPLNISNQLSIGLLFAFFFIISFAFMISGATEEPKIIMEEKK